MAAGDLYRATQRTGGVSNALGPLMNYFQEQKKKKENEEFLKEFMGLFKSGSGNNNKRLQPSQESNNNLQPEGPGGGYFDEDDPQENTEVTTDQNNLSMRTEGNGMETRIPPQSQDNSYVGSTLERPQAQQLGPNNNLAPGGGGDDKYQQSQDRLKQLFMMVLGAPEGFDKAKLNAILGYAQDQSNNLKPKEPNLSFANPEYDVWSNGKKIAEGEKPPKVNNLGKVDKMTSTRVNARGEKIQTWQNQTTGETYEKNVGKVRDTRSRTKENDKNKEKSLGEAFAKDIANLKNFDPHSYDNDNQKIPIYTKDSEGNSVETGEYEKLSATDMKYGKDKILERIKLKLLSRRTYEFVNNIESKWREGDKSGNRQYLSPQELKNESEKHYLAGNIDEEQLREIKAYLQYYSKDIYKGLTNK